MKKCCSKKCQNKICNSNISHLNRIEGQIKKLKEYILEGKDCKDIAILMKSVSNSFESLKNKTMKNFIFNEFGEELTEKKKERIDEIFDNYKR